MFAIENPSVDGFTSGEHWRVYNLLVTTTSPFNRLQIFPSTPSPIFLYTRFPMLSNSYGTPGPAGAAEGSERPRIPSPKLGVTRTAKLDHCCVVVPLDLLGLLDSGGE